MLLSFSDDHSQIFVKNAPSCVIRPEIISILTSWLNNIRSFYFYLFPDCDDLICDECNSLFEDLTIDDVLEKFEVFVTPVLSSCLELDNSAPDFEMFTFKTIELGDGNKVPVIDLKDEYKHYDNSYDKEFKIEKITHEIEQDICVRTSIVISHFDKRLYEMMHSDDPDSVNENNKYRPVFEYELITVYLDGEMNRCKLSFISNEHEEEGYYTKCREACMSTYFNMVKYGNYLEVKSFRVTDLYTDDIFEYGRDETYNCKIKHWENMEKPSLFMHYPIKGGNTELDIKEDIFEKLSKYVDDVLNGKVEEQNDE